ncbi:MAG: hypothetical protein ABSG36_11770 [Acidimicrobiales bacterium]|jgi:hypothetical protein
MPGRWALSAARVQVCLGVALIIAFVVWVSVPLHTAVRDALTVFLAGDLLVVVALQVVSLVRGASSDPFGPSTNDLKLLNRRRRLDPSHRPIVAYLAILVLAFAIPVIVLFGTASSEDAGTPLAQSLSGSSVVHFLLAGISVIVLGTCVWVLVGGSFARRHPPRDIWRLHATRSAKTPSAVQPVEQEVLGVQAGTISGDALAQIDVARLAALLAGLLEAAIPLPFELAALADGSILLKYSERQRIVESRLGRFRLEPAARAVALASQQVLSEVQRFATEALERPWPARPEPEDPRRAPSSPARSRATEDGGLVHLSWQDAFGTVIALEPFALEDVLVRVEHENR